MTTQEHDRFRRRYKRATADNLQWFLYGNRVVDIAVARRLVYMELKRRP